MKIDLTKSVNNFTKSEKARRIIWNCCWFVLARIIIVGNPLRIWALRAFGARVGKRCLVEPGVKIWLPWNLVINDFVVIGRDVEIYNYGKVTIDSMSVVSQYSYLCTGSHDYKHPHMPLIWNSIHIGSGCWIAAGTWIMPGVDIGDGTVIGARSLVTTNMPAWSVCAGHPCKFVKERKIISDVQKDINVSY